MRECENFGIRVWVCENWEPPQRVIVEWEEELGVSLRNGVL